MNLIPVGLMSRQLTTLMLLMVFTFYLTKRCWLGFARTPVLPADLANTAVFKTACNNSSWWQEFMRTVDGQIFHSSEFGKTWTEHGDVFQTVNGLCFLGGLAFTGQPNF